MHYMKTLLISEIFPPYTGGSGRWFWEIYRQQNHSDYIFAVGEYDDAEEFDKHNNPIKTYRLPLFSEVWGIKSLSGLKYYLQNYRNIRRIIKKEGIGRIHCARSLPEAWIALMIKKTLGIPYDCYIHGEDIEMARSSRELSFMAQHALLGADKLICNSHNSMRLLTENWRYRHDQVLIMHPGVDVEEFKPTPYSAVTRKALGWSDRMVILTVSRLQKRKGHDILIQTMPALVEKFPDILYAVVGGGNQLPYLESLVKELKLEQHVMFMGKVNDDKMIECYQQCDLFVLPNRQVDRDVEGFGMVLLEAQASGKPVIAGDSGGTAETMVVDDTGFVVDCTSTGQLTEVLLKLLENKQLREEMGVKARSHIENNFDWRKLGEKAKQVFNH